MSENSKGVIRHHAFLLLRQVGRTRPELKTLRIDTVGTVCTNVPNESPLPFISVGAIFTSSIGGITNDKNTKYRSNH